MSVVSKLYGHLDRRGQGHSVSDPQKVRRSRWSILGQVRGGKGVTHNTPATAESAASGLATFSPSGGAGVPGSRSGLSSMEVRGRGCRGFVRRVMEVASAPSFLDRGRRVAAAISILLFGAASHSFAQDVPTGGRPGSYLDLQSPPIIEGGQRVEMSPRQSFLRSLRVQRAQRSEFVPEVWMRSVWTESCLQYRQRLEADHAALWRHWYCIHGNESGACYHWRRSTQMRPYFYGRQWGGREREGWAGEHGCACVGSEWDDRVGIGQTVRCRSEPPPDPNHIFSDGFESGDTSAWQ